MRKWGLMVAVAAALVATVGATAYGEIGVGARWEGSGITPNMVLPIKMQSGMIIEPEVGFTSVVGTSVSFAQEATAAKPRATQIRVGARFEKAQKPEGTTPLFGLNAMAFINTFSNIEVKSAIDFEIGAFLGGSAKLTDGVDVVGVWGPTVQMIAKRKAKTGDAVISDSETNFGSRASITLRFWLWGAK